MLLHHMRCIICGIYVGIYVDIYDDYMLHICMFRMGAVPAFGRIRRQCIAGLRPAYPRTNAIPGLRPAFPSKRIGRPTVRLHTRAMQSRPLHAAGKAGAATAAPAAAMPGPALPHYSCFWRLRLLTVNSVGLTTVVLRYKFGSTLNTCRVRYAQTCALTVFLQFLSDSACLLFSVVLVVTKRFYVHSA